MTDQPETPAIATMVTDRAGAPHEGSSLVTPGAHTQDVVIRLMTPLAQVIVRGFRTYLQSLLGLLVVMLATPATGIVGPTDPRTFLDTFTLAAGLSLAPAVVSILQNVIELMARIDAQFPRVRA